MSTWLFFLLIAHAFTAGAFVGWTWTADREHESYHRGYMDGIEFCSACDGPCRDES